MAFARIMVLGAAWAIGSGSARAQPVSGPPGETPPVAAPAPVPPPATPAPPPGPAEPQHPRSGGYTDGAYAVGAFTIRGADEKVTRFAIGGQTELGVYINPHFAVFIMSSLMVHHYRTGNDYAKWVFKGKVDRERPLEDRHFWKRTLTITIPFAYLVDSQSHAMIGGRLYFSPSIPSAYFESAGGFSLVMDRPDGQYGGLYGAMAGVGYQVSDRASFGVRGLWSSFGIKGIRPDGQAFSGTLSFTIH